MIKPVVLVLCFLTLFSMTLALMLGSDPIPATAILRVLFHPDQSLNSAIIWHLRIPRIFNAWAVGGLLALSGCLLQVLLQNALADPYILGISGGSAVMTLFALSVGIDIVWLSPIGFAGALFALFLLLACTLKKNQPQHLLLSGVMLSMGFGAIISFILSSTNNTRLDTLIRWLLGDVETSNFPWWPCLILAIGLLVSMRYARQINVLCHGYEKAQSLGVEVTRLRFILLIITSLLTATAVSAAGMIGFVGLTVPHVLRYLKIQDHRLLLPAAAFTGGSLLIIADTVSRVLIAPLQLPIGAITTLLGVPVFLGILMRG